jgi:hypothetical protein
MRRHLVSGALLAIVAVVAYHFAYSDHDPRGTAGSAAAPLPATGAEIDREVAALHGAPTRVPVHVTKLSSPEQRREIANRIAAAQSVHGAHSAPIPPKLPAQPDDTHDLDKISASAMDALKEVIPFLADCYRNADKTHGNKAAVFMTMTGDRDVGTLIDTDRMLDEDHQPLAPELGSCLKTTLESLELPPLSEGDTVKLQYSFVFDDK